MAKSTAPAPPVPSVPSVPPAPSGPPAPPLAPLAPLAPSWHSTTMRPGPRMVTSSWVGGLGATTPPAGAGRTRPWRRCARAGTAARRYRRRPGSAGSGRRRRARPHRAPALPPTEPPSGLACGPQQRSGVLGVGRFLRARARFGERGVELTLRLVGVDLGAELSLRGQDRHLVVGHGQEPTADRRAHPGLVAGDDLDQAALGQDAEHRRAPGQDADVALRGFGDDHAGLARPQLAVGHDQRYVQGHRSSPLALFSTSSIPPTM